MNFFSVISMLGGLALFLYGMDIMGDGLRNSSASALKKILSKVTSNVITGFLLGTVITAIIQSSMATIVLAVGLISAGVLTVRQCVPIVLGANVGTTITAQIIRLIDISSGASGILTFFQPSTLAPIALIVGIVLIMFIKKGNSRNIGNILIGFGVLFTGLMNMISSTSGLAQSEMFKNIIIKFSQNPVLGTLFGIILTVIVQSSSASVGVLQTLCVSGAVTVSGAYSYVVGAAVGTGIVTFIICWISGRHDSRRIGLIHIIFNAFGSTVFLIGFTVIRSAGLFTDFLEGSATSGDVANFETAFKLATALVLIFFIPVLEKLAVKLIKEKTDKNDISAIFDENLFVSPGMALDQTEKAIGDMARYAVENCALAREQFEGYSSERSAKINETEDIVDKLADASSRYLIALSSKIENSAESNRLSYLLRVISEFERISDLAVNLDENATYMNDNGLSFSPDALQEVLLLCEAINQNTVYAHDAFINADTDAAFMIEPLEEVVDDLADKLKLRHYDRLRENRCEPCSGTCFTDILSNTERISDQCSNIALFVLGLYDNTLLSGAHDYIKDLHSGSNSRYTEMYSANRADYMGRLDKIIQA